MIEMVKWGILLGHCFFGTRDCRALSVAIGSGDLYGGHKLTRTKI